MDHRILFRLPRRGVFRAFHPTVHTPAAEAPNSIAARSLKEGRKTILNNRRMRTFCFVSEMRFTNTVFQQEAGRVTHSRGP